MPLEDLLQSLPAEMFNSTADNEDNSSADQKVKLSVIYLLCDLLVCFRLVWILNLRCSSTSYWVSGRLSSL